jgi:hypothetical protein
MDPEKVLDEEGIRRRFRNSLKKSKKSPFYHLQD